MELLPEKYAWQLSIGCSRNTVRGGPSAGWRDEGYVQSLHGVWIIYQPGQLSSEFMLSGIYESEGGRCAIRRKYRTKVVCLRSRRWTSGIGARNSPSPVG